MSNNPADFSFQSHSPSGSVGSPSAEERQWAVFAHLSGFIATAIGGMSFLGPLVIWLIKKETLPFVDDQGKESLNFQLSLLLYLVIAIPVGFVIALLTLGMGVFLFIPIGLCFALFGIICPIMAALAANRGERFRYPLTIRFIS